MKPQIAQVAQGSGIHDETTERLSAPGFVSNRLFPGNAISKILAPLAMLYGWGSQLRVAAYRDGWLKTSRLRGLVISVGNLTVGGTGKTPFVAYLARLLVKRGWHPGILTQGYGRRRGPAIIALEPRADRHADPREVGDEPALLAKALPNVPIVVGSNRYHAGRLAEDYFQVDVHILDDGFQHLALARDVDVVLLDSTRRTSDRALLPAGRQREPCSALRRAGLVVLTRVELGDPKTLESLVRANSQASIFHAGTKLLGLVDLATGRLYPPGAFRGEPVRAFCGVGNPKAFFADLRAWGFLVTAAHAFHDHHIYSAEDLGRLIQGAEKSGVCALVTTEKDAINLRQFKDGGIPILACVIQIELLEAQAFEEALLERLETGRTGSRANGLIE